ncbi:programmed cell death protein 2-like [Prorops nasuta]|uniref:programmed cell death protein 2-like n=1 Tax=Prorops nasuta TaxID=863751 RepID=UPI0034CEDDAD
MACDNRMRVYLGYEDERVTDKHRCLVNYTTNKIGGQPNWHEKITFSSLKCKLCGLQQILALQLYAPLENSKYHRTLYIFTCVNPNCWNQNESWTCLRVQSVDNDSKINLADSSSVNIPTTTSWLANADDWGDNGNDNASEYNGNNLLSNHVKTNIDSNIETDMKDEFMALRVEDLNANSPTSVESPVGIGAVGRLDSPQASAEIDGDESEVVCIDTPTKPQCDIASLLNGVTPFPISIDSNVDMQFQFVEIFISVDEEDLSLDIPQHVRDLLLEYQNTDPDMALNFKQGHYDSKTVETDIEKYEKGTPLHGDDMFHNFVSVIQQNPGQILRYSRDNSAALLLHPLNESIGRCEYCGDELIFEVQILPTLIPKLILHPRTDANFQIEYGTVLIYTCLRSCWSQTDSYKEEHVIVQAEKF